MRISSDAFLIKCKYETRGKGGTSPIMCESEMRGKGARCRYG
jgi:hypothetical protein